MDFRPKHASILRRGRALGAFAHDVIMATIALPLAMYLRYGEIIAQVPREIGRAHV